MTQLVEVEIPVRLERGCGGCSERLRERLSTHPGVELIEPAEGPTLRVHYDPGACDSDCLEAAATEARTEIGETFAHEVLRVDGMDCADCARTIERAVGGLAGVSFASVSFGSARLQVEYTPAHVSPDRVARQVRSLGYSVNGDDGATHRWWHGRDAATAGSAVLVAAAVVLDAATSWSLAARALYAVAIVLAGFRIARAGLVGLRATRRPDMNLLMTLAAIGAATIGAWLEAGLVVVLFALGQALETRAVDRARRELEGLIALAPDTARVRRADATGVVAELEIPVEDLVVGDVVIARPGERLAADGIVLEGESAVDEAPITGESVPAEKAPGGRVFAGSLNGQGALLVRVDARPGDSTLARIGRLVAEAQARRSPSERWVDSFARWYTPLVIAAAAVVMVVPALTGWLPWQTSIYDGLALLILACPCALVISTPVTIVSALGRASAAGVLVKGGAHLEAAATIDTVALDKTGTLTEGRPRLVTVQPIGRIAESEVLRLAASLEQVSEHPLARAVLAAAREGALVLEPVTSFTALTGLGATGTVGDATIMVGNARLTAAALGDSERVSMALIEERGETAVAVIRDGVAIGLLGIADQPRAEAREAIAMLGRLGISRTVMLTGDNERTARAIADRVGVADVRAGLLPQDKATAIESLGGRVLMVGDGVNDAPALAAATVGVAMGSAGSDTAIEVADVALLGDDPRKVAGLIGLARFARAVVRQNIAFSLATKLVAVGLLAFGALPLWGAVASDVGASLIVVANGLRLLRGTPRAGTLRGAPVLAPAPRIALLAAGPATAPAAACCDPAGCASDESGRDDR